MVSITPVWVELSEGVQERATIMRQQHGQHAPVLPGVELLDVARIAAVNGGQADVKVPQQDHSTPCLPKSGDARQ